MKCTACNKTLSDKESTFKDYRGEYPDTCFECLRYIFDTFEGENEETVDKEENM
jgi:hypothetical protein|tara:strand:+ start:343 stop:504 length:162 start_codon:yes stop_codon:yes gene_type:complete